MLQRYLKNENVQAYLYLSPFLIVFTIFLGYPILYSLYISLHSVSLSTNLFDVFSDMRFVGLLNYQKILSDVEFWWSLIVTILYMVFSIPLSIFLSLLLAVILNQKLRALTFFRSSFFLPNILDMLVIGLIWKFIYSPNGLFDLFLTKIGITFFSETGFLGNPKTALFAVSFAMVLKGMGFGMILFLTALQNISPNVFEAADIDGLNFWQKFRYITMPLVKPIILFLTVTGTMASLNAFTEFFIMTEGNPVSTFMGQTVGVTKITGYYIFAKFSEMKYGYSAALSYFMLAFALIISYLNFKIMRED